MVDNSEGDDSQIDTTSPQVIEERIIKPNGDELIKKYRKGKFLGKGGFAKCYEFQCLNNKKIYAVKIVCKANLNKSSAKQKLKSEIKIHKSLFHKHIVKFEHVFEDNDNVYILLELCKNKTLSDIMKKRKIITEYEARYFVYQILKAVNFMHKNKIIHRDLKLGNLFLNEEMEIKIGDFGLATIIEFPGQLRYTVCGTPNYIAPEILEGKNTGHSYEVDFWALGVILYTMLVGRPPYETEDVKETYKKIKANDFSYPTHIFVSPTAKDFINKLLVINPQERLKIDEMKNHAFMKCIVPPKTLPDCININPLPSSFIVSHLIESKGVVNPLNISEVFDQEEHNNYIENLMKFSKQGVIKVSNEVLNHKFSLDKKQVMSFIESNNKKEFIIKRSSSINYRKRTDYTMNMKFLKNYGDMSFNKEYSKSLSKRKEYDEWSINDLFFIETIIDLGEEIGIAYITNNKQVGILFQDRSCVFKRLNEKTEKTEKKNEKNLLYFKESQKPLKEIRNKEDQMKYELIDKIQLLETLIKKFESLLTDNPPSINTTSYNNTINNNNTAKNNLNTNNNNNNITNTVLNNTQDYPQKFFRSEIAYFFKFNNHSTQLIFYDYTKLLIGNNNFPFVIFWDRKDVISSINIHYVNKSKNKNMLKRYEHYKKIFYEKIELRFNDKVVGKDNVSNANNVNNNNNENAEALEGDEIAISTEKGDQNKTL